jgi:energy-converting hydrogenase Eha subunit A
MVLVNKKIYKRAFQRGFNHIIWLKYEGDMIFPNQIIGYGLTVVSSGILTRTVIITAFHEILR